MKTNDYRTGDSAQNARGPNDSHLEGSLQFAGEINSGRSSVCLPVPLQDSTPEWKAGLLEPQLGQLLGSMDEAAIAHDSGVIIGFNQHVPALLGCPPELILWRRLGKFLDPISLPTLTRWMEASDRYTILVNCLHSNGDFGLLRLEPVASVLSPCGRRLEVVTLVEFGPARHLAQSLESDGASRIERT
jgi:hypothetical protein